MLSLTLGTVRMPVLFSNGRSEIARDVDYSQLVIRAFSARIGDGDQ